MEGCEGAKLLFLTMRARSANKYPTEVNDPAAASIAFCILLRANPFAESEEWKEQRESFSAMSI